MLSWPCWLQFAACGWRYVASEKLAVVSNASSKYGIERLTGSMPCGETQSRWQAAAFLHTPPHRASRARNKTKGQVLARKTPIDVRHTIPNARLKNTTNRQSHAT